MCSVGSGNLGFLKHTADTKNPARPEALKILESVHRKVMQTCASTLNPKPFPMPGEALSFGVLEGAAACK